MTEALDVRVRELDRQHQIMLREMPERLVLATLGYALCLTWVPLGPILSIWGLHIGLDMLLTQARDQRRVLSSRWHYGATMAGIITVVVLNVSAAGLVWQSDDPFAKAFAVALVMSVLMHLVTVRSIHLPFGLAGMVGVAGTVLAINTVYWVSRGEGISLTLSTAACFGVLSYSLTAMLANHRLHRMMSIGESMAKAADDAKGRFLAQMSHELRTPLNAIIGMAQTELAEAKANASAPPERAERMQTLTDAARTLALILDDVTDMDAILRGRLSLRPRVLRLSEELSAIAAVHRSRACRLGIPFSTSTEREMPGFVRIDPVRLRQCLGNLMSNALRHAPQGAVQASFRCDLDPVGDWGTLSVEVRDDGPGVAEDQRDAIFEAFHKGRAAAPGSGLGLAIARALARSMGGDLCLLPSDRGAAFRLTLRLQRADPPTLPDAPPDLTGRVVLVVDDVATNRLVAASYLRPWGARVIEAASGALALDILASEDLDLVLLDMNMPGLDGFATVMRAREMGGLAAAVPIVAMTADVMEHQVAAIRQAGLDGYLPKPILPETLAGELTRLLPPCG